MQRSIILLRNLGTQLQLLPLSSSLKFRVRVSVTGHRHPTASFSSEQKPKEDKKLNEDEDEEVKGSGPGRDQKSQSESDTSNYALPVTKDFFSSTKEKNKETFTTALEVFQVRDKNARGHVEFIRAALKNMKYFGVHRDLETYKKLIDIFPKGRFIAQNMFQVEFMHYPKQQDCAIEVLDQMEDMGVIPDSEMQILLTNIFGSYAFPLRKLGRMLYWMPKFKHLSPWPIPDPLPEDGLELAKLAIQRMTSVDLQTQITCLQTKDFDGAVDDTWIVSGQSPSQQKLIQGLPPDQPAIYVEGAFRIWISRTCINYFILRAPPRPVPTKEKDVDDVGSMSSIFEEDYVAKEIVGIPGVHEQDDGIILGICATGTSSRDSLISWLQFIQETNPRLGKDIPVLITLKSPIGPTDDLEVQELGQEDQEKPKPLIGEDPHKFKKDGKDEIDMRMRIGFDPSDPDLSQVGIGSMSDSSFLNWPHHYNPKSIQRKIDKQKQKLMAEAEKQNKRIN